MAHTTHPAPRSRETNSRKAPQPKQLSDKVGASLREFRQRFAVSQALLARLLGVSLRTVSGLETGGAEASDLVRRNFTQASRLCEAAAEAVQPGYLGQWLDEPNEMLGGLKPVEAVERGQIDLVWQVVEGLRSGSPL